MSLGGLFGGGGGGGGFPGISGGISSIPIIGGLFGAGNGQGNAAPSMPMPSGAYPGVNPQSWPGFPVPQHDPNAAPRQNFQGDLSKPGAGENFFAQNQGKYTQPGALSNWWQGNQKAMGEKGPADEYWAGLAGKWNAPGTSNNAQTAWNQFQGSTPANTDPYYDNAVRLASRDINSQMAARGLYGGGTGAAPVNEAITNLRAQQAKDNAGYGLQRAGLGGQLAQGADASSMNNLQGQLGWMTGLGNLGLGVQNADLNRMMGGAGIAGNLDQSNLNFLNSGMQGAMGAQGALENRGQNFFNNNLQMGNALSQAMQNIYMQQIAADMGLSDNQLQTALGYGTNAANESVNNQQRSETGIMNGVSTMMGGMGL